MAKIKIWKKGGRLSAAIRQGSVTLVIGCPGSGKTETTSVLAGMAKADGRAIHLVGRCLRPAEPVEDGEVDNQLYQTVLEAGEGDLVIGREVFQCDNVNFRRLMIPARKRNVTVLLEMQSADLRAARDAGCDVLVMRMMPDSFAHDSLAKARPDLAAKDIERISRFRPGEAIMLSQARKPASVRVEISQPAQNISG